jgi:hypothetical protein
MNIIFIWLKAPPDKKRKWKRTIDKFPYELFLIEPGLKDAKKFFSLNCYHEHRQNFFKNGLDLVT